MSGIIIVDTAHDGMTLLTAISPSGGWRQRKIEMLFDEFEKAYHKWRKGTLIQNAFPDLSYNDREFILSGTDENEWNEMIQKVKKKQ